jgi:hypothetical protein
MLSGLPTPLVRDVRSASVEARSQRAEERANVVNEQFGLFHRGEVTAARHLSPSLDVEKPFGPFTSV